jgi:hypothetical protein
MGAAGAADSLIVTFSSLPRLFRMKIVRHSLLTTLVLCLSSFGQDAAMFRGPARSGVYKAQGIPKFSQVKWEVSHRRPGDLVARSGERDGLRGEYGREPVWG